MINSQIKKFVITQLEQLSSLFPSMSFVYGFDTIAQQHLIEVQPNTEYNNPIYMDAELNILDAFMNKFPTEELLFISDEKFINVKNPIYKIGGFHLISNCITVGKIQTSSLLVSANMNFPNDLAKNIWQSVIADNYSMLNINTNDIKAVIVTPTIVNAGESNYALAA